MRHIPLSIFAIVAILGIVAMLFSVSLVSQPSFLAVSYIPSSEPLAKGTVVAKLGLGEFLGNKITAVGEAQLSGLQSGTVHGKDVRTSYVQNIRFRENGLFNGCHVEFGKDESNKVSDFLQCDDDVFKYSVEFSPGLRSVVDGSSLPEIEEETLMLLGDSYSIVDTDVNTALDRISLRLFGGFGSIEFKDNNYGDDLFQDGGLEVNGRSVGARVRIKASETGNKLSIFSIQYILKANAVRGGVVQVLPLHCTREFLQYPLGLLSPNFDICYKGLKGEVAVPSGEISANEVHVKALGDDEYVMIARNIMGQQYSVPLAQLPGMYGIKGRNFHFVEAAAPGAPNINLDDYFLVNSKNDVQGVSHVLRYDQIENSNVYFEDLATSKQRSATFDIATGEGRLLMSEGTYRFVVGAGNSLAMDQTNDGNINGGEARFVFPGGSRADFGPGFTVTIITPQKLFDEPAGDENTVFNVLFGANIDLNVPSPQGAVFALQSESGGVKKGMTRYGIQFIWEQESESDDLKIFIPGAYARSTKGSILGDVFITLERAKLVKPVQQPAAKCGDSIISGAEYCDPPNSICSGRQSFERGVCSQDCSSCIVRTSVCGNALLEKSEECESSGDCPAGFGCSSCKCLPLPALCGNNLLESTEQCEKDVDCAQGFACSACSCVNAPLVEVPASVVLHKPNVFARFFLWLANAFGG